MGHLDIIRKRFSGRVEQPVEYNFSESLKDAQSFVGTCGEAIQVADDTPNEERLVPELVSEPFQPSDGGDEPKGDDNLLASEKQGEPIKVDESTPQGSLPDGRTRNEYGEWEFDDDFEESLIALLVRNKEFRTKYGYLIRAEYFSSQRASDIYIIASEYFEKYENEIDKSILKNEIKQYHANFKHRDESVEAYLFVADRMFDLDISTIAEYAADKIIRFARRRQIKINLRVIAQNVMGEEEKLEACRGKIDEALDIGKEIFTPKPPIDITFPRDTIMGFLKKFADTYSQNFESPWEFWVFNGAAFLGDIIAKRVRLETSLKTEPRLYVACIGKSGITRKSECERQTFYLFKEYFDEYLKDQKLSVCRGVGSANGLAKFLLKHPCGILLIDEMRTIIQKTGIKGSVLLETLTGLFDDNHYSNYTKDEKIDIQDASLSFIGSTTIKIWDEMFDAPSVGTGLVNRLWIVPGETDKIIPIPNIPEREKLKVMVSLTTALEKFPVDKTITLSMEVDAEELWNNWYRENKTEKSYDETSTRLDTYGSRFMMILAASEGRTSIDADLVARVISLLEWQKNVRILYQPKDFNNPLARTEDRIRKAGLENKVWKRGELEKKVHAERDGLDVFNRALKNLEVRGALTGTGKREKIRFLNPH